MKYGFSDAQLKEITDIFSAYGEIEKAILFDSRAIDTYVDDFDFGERFGGLKAEFEARLKEEATFNQRILENLAKVNYRGNTV